MPSFRYIEENLRHALRLYACAKDGGHTCDVDGVTMVASGVDFCMFNPVLLTKPLAGTQQDLDRCVRLAAKHFAAKGLRWSYWVCTDMLDRRVRPHVSEVFSSNGLRHVSIVSGMLAERIKPPRHSLAPLFYRRVGDAATRADFSFITSTAFHLPFPTVHEIYQAEGVWNGKFTGFVGYLDGVAVTTAATMTAADSIGIYSVATLPEFRKRGLGEAILRYALAEAQRETGITRSVLQATAVGFPMYERLGYKHVTDFSVYISG